MNCLCPISIPDSILSKFGQKGHSLLVPCGHCSECARDRRNDWFVRIWSEYQNSLKKRESVWFFTASIDQDLWPDLTLDSPGVGDRITPFVRSWTERFRYLNHGTMPTRFMCSEFGSLGREYIGHDGKVRITTGALHFHGLIFGNIDIVAIGSGLKKTHGYVDFDLIRGPEAIRYVVKYATKDFSIDDYKLRARVFCSPGIGDPTYYFGDSAPTPMVLINGFHYRTPRYFIDKQWMSIYGKERFTNSIGSSILVDQRARARIDQYYFQERIALAESKADPVLRRYLFDKRVLEHSGPASLSQVLLLLDQGKTGCSHPLLRYYLRRLAEIDVQRELESDRSFVNYVSPIKTYYNQFNLNYYERDQTIFPLPVYFET